MKSRETEAHSNGQVLDDEVLEDKAFSKVLEDGASYSKTADVRNQDRAVATRIAGAIARAHGDRGLVEKGGTVDLTYRGAAGQSFGAFSIPGLLLKLEGQANDYVGKSMCGGTICIRPSGDFKEDTHRNVILGNTCAYGATGGNLFAAGRAGERLAVRNSGCRVVVEGTGDHCCEYMTAGRVVVLGGVGRNLGAGMTGGIAYIMDDSADIDKRINTDVRIQKLQTQAAIDELKELIKDYQESTGSLLAKEVLEDFDSYLPKFWQVIPPAEDNTILTHADASAVPELATASTTTEKKTSRAPAVAMSADPPTTSFKFTIEDSGKAGPLDRNYWGKNL